LARRLHVLGLEAVSSGYDGTRVLWEVSLNVEPRKITVVVGPNGAGKSTTLKVINGLLRPWSGTVRMDGEDISRLSTHERVARGIASVPEGRRLFPSLTAEGNLRLGAFTRRARSAVDESLDAVYQLFPKLRERAKVKAGRLSGGEQQMVAIGRALMAKPSLLVLDEPSLGLAPKLMSEITATIEKLRSAGQTVLMVEQNAYQALRIADFGYVMQEGRIVKSGPPDQLLDMEELRKTYFAIG
jgi:branched-chain amino acid transport system ATP-binding protein